MPRDHALDVTDRRTFLRGVGAATATAVAGTGPVAGDSLDADLAAVEEATAEYADPRRALDDGYRVMGPFVAGMGWHFVHEGRLRDAAESGFTATEPQLLTYGDAGEGLDGLVLGAVEYAVPVGARDYTEDAPPDLFVEETDEETWHTHHAAEHVFAVQADASGEDLPESTADVPPGERLRSTRWLEVAPGGTRGDPAFEPGTAVVGDFRGGEVMDARVVVDSIVHRDWLTLHAWVHLDNPEGVFEEHNPDLPSEPRA